MNVSLHWAVAITPQDLSLWMLVLDQKHDHFKMQSAERSYQNADSRGEFYQKTSCSNNIVLPGFKQD